MSFFPSRTVFLQIGSISIRWYAVLILTGAFIAYYFSKKNLKEYRNIDINDFFDNVFIYMLWGGIIGARLWYVVFDSTTNYLENPMQIIRIWDGGLAFHGAFVGGALVALLYCRKRNVSFIKFLDAIVPTVLFAQAMGRWGNFVNQECFGATVDESYFNGILSFLKDDMFINGAYREPMFFFESTLCLLGFVLINFVLRKYQNKRGDLTWAYLMWYGVVRFFIEGHRTDSLLMNITGLKTAQVTSVIYVIIGVLGFFGIIDKFFKKKKPTLLFDFDGTLQDSEKCIIMTYNELFKRHDDEKNFTKERQVEVLGPGLYEIFPKYFPKENPDDLYKEYQEIIAGYLPQYLKEMPYAIETLKALKEEGYTIGIVTTRSNKSTKECLDITGIGEYIDDFIGFNEVKNIKPHIEAYDTIVNRNKWNKDDIIVIGDSSADIKGGQNYGAYTVAYLSNEDKKETVLNDKPNTTITDLREMLKIVKEKHYFTYNLK